MGYTKDLTGIRFGRLVAESSINNNKHGCSLWSCVCDCGGRKIVSSDALRRGTTKSCGCISKEHPHNIRHGGRNTKLYNVWRSMKQRCQLKTSISYCNYGARGITVCNEWQQFAAFQEWALLEGYSVGLSIDRIDNNKGYYPENCRWSDAITQANNKTTNRTIKYRDKKLTLAQWARELNIPYHIVNGRTQKGWSMDRIVRTSYSNNK